jgi:hypothetical protein
MKHKICIIKANCIHHVNFSPYLIANLPNYPAEWSERQYINGVCSELGRTQLVRSDLMVSMSFITFWEQILVGSTS